MFRLLSVFVLAASIVSARDIDLRVVEKVIADFEKSQELSKGEDVRYVILLPKGTTLIRESRETKEKPAAVSEVKVETEVEIRQPQSLPLVSAPKVKPMPQGTDILHLPMKNSQEGRTESNIVFTPHAVGPRQFTLPKPEPTHEPRPATYANYWKTKSFHERVPEPQKFSWHPAPTLPAPVMPAPEFRPMDMKMHAPPVFKLNLTKRTGPYIPPLPDFGCR